MDMFSDVRDFHIAAGNIAAEIPGFPDDNIRQLRRQLLTEEVREYDEAEKQNDIVNLSGELADIIYIICGTAVSYGIIVKREYVSFGSNIIPVLPDTELRDTRIGEIKKYYLAYLKAEEENNFGKVSDALLSLLDNVYACAYIYGIPLIEVFNAVHQANMNKLIGGKIVKRSDGKIQKPLGWQPANLQNILFPNNYVM